MKKKYEQRERVFEKNLGKKREIIKNQNKG